MNTAVDLPRQNNRVNRQAHPVKVTAIQYILEALAAERYEELKDLVAIAREFGADDWDIRIALSGITT